MHIEGSSAYIVFWRLIYHWTAYLVIGIHPPNRHFSSSLEQQIGLRPLAIYDLCSFLSYQQPPLYGILPLTTAATLQGWEAKR